MICFGNVPAGAVLPIPFATYGKTNGESITLTGLAVTDIEVYKGTSMTQRASDAGYALMDTDGIDIDGVTGLHGFSIDTGDNTDSGFYVAGSFYTVVVSTVTIDSETVTFIAATFRLMAAESVSGSPKADVSHFGGSAGTFSGGRPEVNASHAAGTAWNSGAIGAATFAANAINAAKLDPDVTTELQTGLATAAALATVDGIVDDILADTADMQPKLGTPAGASISADIAAIEGQTDDIGVAGAGLTAVPWNPAWDAEVQSEVQDAIEANHLDHLLATTYDPASKPGAADALLNELVESDAGVARYTANALEQAPTGGSAPSAADIADAVWEEAIADHSGTAGSTAEALNAAGSAGDPWVTALPGAYGAGSAGKILGDNLNATVSSRATQTSVDDLPTNAELATALGDIPTAAENASQVRTELTTELGRIDAAVSTRATPAQVATELGTYDAPTKAEMDAALAAADDAVLAAIAALNNLSAAGVRTALGMASANLDAQLAALPTATENADALLTRDFTAVTGEAARSALNALRFLRNRWAIAGGTLTVYEEDDTTQAWTGAATQTAGDPVSQVDPS